MWLTLALIGLNIYSASLKVKFGKIWTPKNHFDCSQYLGYTSVLYFGFGNRIMALRFFKSSGQ